MYKETLRLSPPGNDDAISPGAFAFVCKRFNLAISPTLVLGLLGQTWSKYKDTSLLEVRPRPTSPPQSAGPARRPPRRAAPPACAPALRSPAAGAGGDRERGGWGLPAHALGARPFSPADR